MASLNAKTGVLGTRLAAHLLRRTSFNYSRERVDELAAMTVAQAIDNLLPTSPASLVYEQPRDPVSGEYWVNVPAPIAGASDFSRRRYLTGWWFNELIEDPGIQMKMSFFLHTNFATSWRVSGLSENLYDHHMLLRHYSLGNFRELAKKVTVDNLMLRYLNNNVNRNTAPNENYARELLELFTIGKGDQIAPGNYTNYTEDDIKEAAKVLTGFTTRNREAAYIDPDTGLYAGFAYFPWHETSNKTFSSAFGNTVITAATDANDMHRELDDFLDMIFAQDETARFIVRKIYRHFVHTELNAEVEADIIEPLAAIFRNGNYELRPVMEALLSSQHFYNEDSYGMSNKIIGGMIKSPIESMAHIIKFFNIQLPDQDLQTSSFYSTFAVSFVENTIYEATGFRLNAPDTVASYPAYHQAPQWDNNWFISSTIIPRYKLGQMFVTDRKVLASGSIGAQMDTVSYVEDTDNISDPGAAAVVVDELVAYLFPEIPEPARVSYFLNDIFLEGLNELNWYFEWQAYLSTMNDSDVRIPLDALVISLIGTPEFQCM